MALCRGQLTQTFRHLRPLLHPLTSYMTPCAFIGVYEKDRRSGYQSKIKTTKKEALKKGFKAMRGEFGKFREEMKTKFSYDNLYPAYHGDYEVLWKFDHPKVLDNFNVTCDSDHGEGKSQAEFFLNDEKKAVFRGYINTDVPQDGQLRRAGYANIKSHPNMRSFMRKQAYDWTDYTHLVIRCRGDGRPYQLILHMDRYFDVSWNDTYQFVLFTRGGPYWQVAKIPFSKFFLGSKGRIQDKQTPIELHQVLSVGVTIADRVKGPFQLEIDYMALLVDKNHRVLFDYEMYECNPSALY